MSPLRFVLMLPNGQAQLVTSDDVAHVGASKLPGGAVALSLTLRPELSGLTPGAQAFTLNADAQTALEILGGYLGAPAVEAAPTRRPGARSAPRGDVLPLFPPGALAATVEAGPVADPGALGVEAAPQAPGEEARVGAVAPRPVDESKAHKGSSKSGGFHPSAREPKPREKVAQVIEAAPIPPAELAKLPRPLSHAQAAADVVNLGDRRLTTRELGERWGWAHSTVSVFLRSAAIKVHPDADPVSLEPFTRAPDNRPLSELRAELDAVSRPAPWRLVARYLRRSVEANAHPGDLATLAALWGWDVALIGHLWSGVVRQHKAA